MTHISGFERSQILLLPEAVDDYVGADNPVRFIDAFVDELDLSAAGFVRVAAKATGRPGYAPADLLKLYIYGYLNRVRSSRRLECQIACNSDPIRVSCMSLINHVNRLAGKGSRFARKMTPPKFHFFKRNQCAG
jgi:transposase